MSYITAGGTVGWSGSFIGVTSGRTAAPTGDALLLSDGVDFLLLTDGVSLLLLTSV